MGAGRGRIGALVGVAFAVAGLCAACEGTPDPAPPTTRSIAAELGLARTTSTDSDDNCVADWTGDGTPELLLLNHGDSSGAQLMRDPGSGSFVQLARFPTYDYHSCAPADFNRDGRLDVYLGAGGCSGLCSGYPKKLFLQQPDGTFRDVAAAWGVTEPTGRGRSVVVLDVNRDGFPDLFTGNEIRVEHPTPNRLFVNVGGTRMVDATAQFGLPLTEVGGLCAETTDYDDDGFTDLLVCGKQRTFLYRNVGGARFVDATTDAGLSTSVVSDAKFTDVDGDGDDDAVLLSWNHLVLRRKAGGRFPVENARISVGAGGADLAAGDADGDRDVDLYAVTSKVGAETTQRPDLLLLNDGSGAFTQLATPQATTGSGDSAEMLSNWRGRGGSLIVVNNGRYITAGLRQAIEVVVSPTPSTTTTTTTTTEPPTTTTTTEPPTTTTTTEPEPTTTTTEPEPTTTTTEP